MTFRARPGSRPGLALLFFHIMDKTQCQGQAFLLPEFVPHRCSPVRATLPALARPRIYFFLPEGRMRQDSGASVARLARNDSGTQRRHATEAAARLHETRIGPAAAARAAGLCWTCTAAFPLEGYPYTPLFIRWGRKGGGGTLNPGAATHIAIEFGRQIKKAGSHHEVVVQGCSLLRRFV